MGEAKPPKKSGNKSAGGRPGEVSKGAASAEGRSAPKQGTLAAGGHVAKVHSDASAVPSVGPKAPSPAQQAAPAEVAAPGPAPLAVGPGTQLGPYRLTKKLGQGGMGAVYTAVHVHLDKVVAIKVLPQHVANNPAIIARFQREMKAVGKVDHQHIVRAMDAGEVSGVMYLAMEHLEGTDLQQLVVSQGPLPIGDACEAVRQAAVGLAAAHGQGLVHRDIKPANLFLTKDNAHIKVLDLGLAQLNDDPGAFGLTSPGQCMGTPDYMAPEQWEDFHSADARTDLYALGCTLFYLLVGRAPYGTEQFGTIIRKMRAHADETIPDLKQARPDVPAELAAIYGKLMAKHPEDRIPSATDLASALAPFCSTIGAVGCAVAATPSAPPVSKASSLSVMSPKSAGRTGTGGASVALGTAPPSLAERLTQGTAGARTMATDVAQVDPSAARNTRLKIASAVGAVAVVALFIAWIVKPPEDAERSVTPATQTVANSTGSRDAKSPVEPSRTAKTNPPESPNLASAGNTSPIAPADKSQPQPVAPPTAPPPPTPPQATPRIVMPNTTGSVVRLFNQKDLTGFHTHLLRISRKQGAAAARNQDPDGVFSVVDRELRISGQHRGALVTDQEFANYHLIIEFRWGEEVWPPRQEKARHSGVMLHCPVNEDAFNRIAPHAIVCKIVEGGTGDFALFNNDGPPHPSISVTAKKFAYVKDEVEQTRWLYWPGVPLSTFNSGVVRRSGNTRDWEDIKGFHRTGDVERPSGEWNRLECTCQIDRVTIWLNGKVVNAAVNVTPQKGRIGFQSEGAEIFFRKIELEQIAD